MTHKNILVIAAHPDDEVLGCGGTIARLASQGARVSIVILANGLTSRPGFCVEERDPLLEEHHMRAERAGKLLGGCEVKVLGFPDQKMDTLPLLDITQAIEKETERVCPDTIFVQHGGDLNMDHNITFRAAMTATRPVKGHCVKRLYAYEVPSSTEWAFQRFAPQFQPNVFFDIEPWLEAKIAAMEVYESECREFPHPRSPEAMRNAAQRWGSVVGCNAAEAFDLVRAIF